MARPTVVPRPQERAFGPHELFFSTTDRKGIIRSGNQVFVRVSAHPLEKLLGAPHNIIRHPDMPRAVFQLLWSYLDQGKPFAGFVKNMAADGCYYWVMALVVPIDGGYLSVRLKPSSAYFPVVRDLYTELVAIERAAGDDGGAWRDGMARATARLVEAIGSLGFASYDEFMRIALAAELSGHRDAQRALAGTGHEHDAVTDDLAPTLASCGAVEHGLDDLFSRVDGLLATIKQLGTAATYVLGLAGDIHLISLNALVGSCRLERGGEGLSVVTEDLARLSQECTDNVNAMAVQLRELSASLGETAFSVTAAKLQIEMTSCFIRELSHERLAEPDATADARLRGDLRTLTESLMASTAQLIQALPRAQAPIPRLIRLQHELETDLRRLSSVHLIGAIQAVGIPEAGMFRELLDRIVGQLQRSTGELEQLAEGVMSLREHLPVFERTALDARRATESFRAVALKAA